MPQPDAGDRPEVEDYRGLQRQVHDLETRVAQLEERFAPKPFPALAATPDLSIDGTIEGTVSAIPALGRCLLGLAGAYLLRALTESKTLPASTGVAVGILYAAVWLYWASRAPATRRAEAALRSLTAALILAPLLWEAALHFQAISDWAIAVVLILFTIFGLTITWRCELHVVAVIAAVAGLGTASALLLGTHDVAPFLIAVLALAAVVEISACLDHWSELRWIVALPADVMVVLATYLVSRAGGLPESYSALPHGVVIAALCALPAIYLTSIVVRVFFRGFQINWFEIAQATIALTIGALGGLSLSRDPRVAAGIGGVLLLIAAAAYFSAFVVLARRSQPRSYHALAIFGFALAVAGVALQQSRSAAAILWSILAVLCMLLGSRTNRAPLLWHGALFLVAAAWTSGVLEESASVLLASSTGIPSRGLIEWIAGAAALLCFLAVVRRPQHGVPLVIAAILVWQITGVTAGFLTGAHHSLFGMNASHDYCATIRTGVFALAAVLLAWSGQRWRPELSWLLYPMMALGAYRLAIDDLRLDSRAAAILSLVLYGAALVILPRIVARPASTRSLPVSS